MAGLMARNILSARKGSVKGHCCPVFMQEGFPITHSLYAKLEKKRMQYYMII